MKKNLIFLCLFCFGFLPFSNAQTIDTEKSIVNFKIGNMKIRTVKGTFQGMKGTLAFDPGNLAAANFNICIDVASVDTGNKKRDQHLLKEDFFFEATYPQICFESTAVEKTAEAYLTKGNLTIHGISKEVDLPFTFDGKTFRGNLEVSRYDFGVGIDTGTFMVAEEVAIEIIGELVE